MLIYCSFPIMGYSQKPQWVDNLKNSLFVKSQEWLIYDPYIKVGEQPTLLDAVPQLQINKLADTHHALLKIHELCLSSSPEAIQQLFRSDVGDLATDVIFKDLYFLIRSNIVIVDLNHKSSGGTPQEVLYAHILNIPIYGISAKSHQSPWMYQRMRAVLNPRSIDDVIEEILTCKYATK